MGVAFLLTTFEPLVVAEDLLDGGRPGFQLVRSVNCDFDRCGAQVGGRDRSRHGRWTTCIMTEEERFFLGAVKSYCRGRKNGLGTEEREGL